jgi:TatD DNase family protein
MSKIYLVDSHCHLNDPSYGEDRESVIARAQAQGITTFLSIATKLGEADDLLALTHAHPSIYCSVGVHPHEAQAALQAGQLYEDLLRFGKRDKVIALGETGLDYYYEHSPKAEQNEAFSIHIRVAQELDLPLIVHTRDAEEDTIACLKSAPSQPRGVIHCFSGTQYLADAALALGFYISVSGIITFKKADELRAVIETVPLDRLLLETDAPYLAPIPYRGKRNEPAYMIETAKVLAQLKGVSLEEISAQTTKNFYSLFTKIKL